LRERDSGKESVGNWWRVEIGAISKKSTQTVDIIIAHEICQGENPGKQRHPKAQRRATEESLRQVKTIKTVAGRTKT
jgi:hypothetical protein